MESDLLAVGTHHTSYLLINFLIRMASRHLSQVKDICVTVILSGTVSTQLV